MSPAAVGDEAATRPATQPTTQPATRPVDLSVLETLLYDVADELVAMSDEERQSLREPSAESDVAMGKLRPHLERVGELDLATLEVPAIDPVDFDVRLVTGLQGLASVAIGDLSREVSTTPDAIDAAGRRAVDLAQLLPVYSRMTGTTFWFQASELDRALLRWFASRSASMTPETREAMAAVPRLRAFHESTGEEGKLLVERLRQADELPEWVASAAGRVEGREADDVLVEWRADWADPATKAVLIEEYDLHFAVEVEMAELTSRPAELTDFLEAWEESHEDQARWLARYTLVSPRQAYALQYRVQTLRDLYATAVAG
ncbi:MAG: hypothetical protein AAF561_06990, partial [Planctomycetota bacterium]